MPSHLLSHNVLLQMSLQMFVAAMAQWQVATALGQRDRMSKELMESLLKIAELEDTIEELSKHLDDCDTTMQMMQMAQQVVQAYKQTKANMFSEWRISTVEAISGRNASRDTEVSITPRNELRQTVAQSDLRRQLDLSRINTGFCKLWSTIKMGEYLQIKAILCRWAVQYCYTTLCVIDGCAIGGLYADRQCRRECHTEGTGRGA